MRTLLLTGAAFGCLMMGPLSARADTPIYTFSGSGGVGTSGTLLGLTQAWAYGGPHPSSDIGWGSPGVSAGATTYAQSIPATDFQITFTSGTLDASQITVGNNAGCGGAGSTSGTQFCVGGVQWVATPIGTNGIVFDAPAGSLTHNQTYHVNVFLSSIGDSGKFTGDWSISVPEPTSMGVVGSGMLALNWFRRRRR